MKNLFVLFFLSLFLLSNPAFSTSLNTDGGSSMIIEPKTSGVELTFNLAQKHGTQFSILIQEATGQKVVFQAETKHNRVFVPRLASGSYLVTVIYGEGVVQEELSF